MLLLTVVGFAIVVVGGGGDDESQKFSPFDTEHHPHSSSAI